MQPRDDSIVLRPWRATDLPELVDAVRDPDIRRWCPAIPRPYTDGHARAFIAGSRGAYDHEFAIEQDGRLVGSISLRVNDTATGHIGYWCVKDARGRGITTYALRHLCRFALGDLGLQRLELTTDPDNTTSQHVAERVGFQREGLLRSHMAHPDGRRRDTVIYSLLPGELT